LKEFIFIIYKENMALNKCISEMVKCEKCPFLAPLYFQILAGTLLPETVAELEGRGFNPSFLP
jgi:hypothetical protein